MNKNQILTQPFIDCTRGNGFSYFRISKTMLQFGPKLGISTDEVLLYTLLRDRAKLSYENQNYDQAGRLFVFCTRPNAASYFGWSQRKVVGLFHALAEHHLIEEEPLFDAKGQQKATRIFLNIWSTPNLVFSQEDFLNLRFPALTIDSLLNSDIGDYYILPKALLEEERYHGVSLRAMLLYMLLLDRISLSQRYGRQDQNGLLWTTMDADLIARELDCSKRSLTRATGELEDIGLIERHAVSYSEKWRIYVRDFLPTASSALPAPCLQEGDNCPSNKDYQKGDSSLSPSDANSAPPTSQICTPVTPNLHPSDAKFAPSVTPNLHPNKHSINKPSINKHSYKTNIPVTEKMDVLDFSMDALKKDELAAVKSIALRSRSMDFCHYSDVIELCYTELNEQNAEVAIHLLDFTTEVIQNILTSPLPYFLLGKEKVAKEEMLQRLSELDAFSMFLILQKIEPQWKKIKDKEAYIRRTLYLGSRQHRQEAYFLEKTFHAHCAEKANCAQRKGTF